MGILNFLLRLLSHLARIIHMLSSHGADKLRPKDDEKNSVVFLLSFSQSSWADKKVCEFNDARACKLSLFSLLISWSDFNC